MNSKIEELSKILILVEVKLLSEYNGTKCPKCGLIQGLPNDKLGVHIWYCDWVYKKINKKIKKAREKIVKMVFDGIGLQKKGGGK